MFTNFLKKRTNRLQWKIDDVDLSYVNAIRRILLAEIPNAGVDFDPISDKNVDMDIHKNTSSLHNEFLAHRISLVPMCFSENEIATFDPTKYVFRLQRHNKGHQIMNVTSRDIDILDENGKKYDDEFHRRIFPPHPITKDYILITKLKPNHYNPENGEEIDITFRPMINIAKKHSRWCPVSTVMMNNVIDDDGVQAAWKAKLQKLEEMHGPMPQDAQDAAYKRFMTLDALRCFKKNEYDEACSFNFGIRSICALRPEYLFFKAIQVLRQKVHTFKENIHEPSDAVVIAPIGEIPNFYEITIRNEDFTLLNVLQCIAYNKCMREKKDTRLSYIGYHDPHPLDPKMILKVRFNETSKVSEEELRVFMEQVCVWILNDLDSIAMEWINASGLGQLAINEVNEFVKTQEK